MDGQTTASKLPEGFGIVLDGTHNVSAIREVASGVHGRVELQVLFNHMGPKGSRYHYQDVPVHIAAVLKQSKHPTEYLKSTIKPYYHCYRADMETGELVAKATGSPDLRGRQRDEAHPPAQASANNDAPSADTEKEKP